MSKRRSDTWDAGLGPATDTPGPIIGRMTDLQVLDAETAGMVEGVCDAIVPGSARVRPAVYVDALLARMDGGTRGRGDRRVRVARRRRHRRARRERPTSSGCARSRSRRSTATSSRPASRRPAPGRRSTSTRRSPRGWRRTGRTWGSDERALRRRRRRLRRGRRRRRGRARRSRTHGPAARVRPAPHGRRLHPLGGEGEPRLLVAGPLRADRRRRPRRRRAARRPLRRRHDDGQHEGRAARARPRLRQVARRQRPRRRRRARRSAPPISTRTTTGSRRASACASAPTGRRACTRSSPASGRSAPQLEPVRSYTDANCMSCGSCLQGCPTNAGKSTLNTYIHDAWAAGRLELRAGANVERVVIEDGEATGVEYVDGDGRARRVDAGAVVVAAGTLNTPQLLLRSGLPDSASSRLIGRNLGFHPVRLVYGLFDEPQDAHMVYPITAHAMAHQRDEDGGFVLEATTIQDPIGFATTLEDENGPLWGQPLVDAVRGFRHWIGVLAMVNDDNNGVVALDEDGRRDVQRAASSRRSTSASTQRSPSRARCSRPRVQRPSAGRGSPRRTCRERAGWAATRRARSSTPTRSRGTCKPALRRRRLGHPAHDVGEPVADDHGARGPPRLPPRRRSARLPRG